MFYTWSVLLNKLSFKDMIKERQTLKLWNMFSYHWSRFQDLADTALFYRASDWLPPYQHHVERSLMCVECRGSISRSGITQDIKMGSCVFQCDVPHQWIAQRQVGLVSVYCGGAGCHVLCLRRDIPVWQHIGYCISATSKHRRIWPQMLNPNKQNTK